MLSVLLAYTGTAWGEELALRMVLVTAVRGLLRACCCLLDAIESWYDQGTAHPVVRKAYWTALKVALQCRQVAVAREASRRVLAAVAAGGATTVTTIPPVTSAAAADDVESAANVETIVTALVNACQLQVRARSKAVGALRVLATIAMRRSLFAAFRQPQSVWVCVLNCAGGVGDCC